MTFHGHKMLKETGTQRAKAVRQVDPVASANRDVFAFVLIKLKTWFSMKQVAFWVEIVPFFREYL